MSDSGIPGETPPAGVPDAPGCLIEMVPVAQLKPRKGNPRTHSKKQIRQIARSIERFDFTNPVLIDDDGGIIAGHGRVAAAKLLGMNEVPVRRLSHLTPAQRRAYVIADNRLAEQAGWDSEILAIELQGLIDLEFDIELTGFEAPEIDLVLEDADETRREAAGPEDQSPEPSTGLTITLPGDVWLLGKHRLVCGDARDAAAYHGVLDGDKAQFVITDQPYNVSVSGHACRGTTQQIREFAMAAGEMSVEEFTKFLATVFGHLARYSNDGAIIDTFVDWRHLNEMLTAGQQNSFELLNLCVWAKKNFGMGNFYRSQHELCFVWKTGNTDHINNLNSTSICKSRSNLWQYAGVKSTRAGQAEELGGHGTVRPVALIADAIRDCSRRNGIVLDAFMGSGTTLIAAERTGRRACGIEIDPYFVDVAVRRWQTYSGRSATLAGTNQTFEEIECERTNATVHTAGDAPADAEFQEAA